MRNIFRSWIIPLVAALAIVSSPAATRCLAADLPEAISFGTSSIGGTFYVIAVGMGDLISKNTPMSVTVESVGGSDANMRAIKYGKVEVAMANTFTTADAYFGKGTFEKEGQVDIQLLALGQPSMRQLVVRADAGIRTVADLKGKRLAARRKSNADLELVANAMVFTGEKKRTENLRLEPIPGMEIDEDAGMEAEEGASVDGW